MSFQDWDAVEAEVRQVVNSCAGSFDAPTVDNVRDLMSVCRVSCPLPKEVAKGYWSTVCISWPNFEIEVFESRLELYDFKDGSTSIWYEEHTPGQHFATRFLEDLSRLTRKEPTPPK
jgi:hypothetical protein